MNQWIKKTITLTLVAGMLTLTLAGCGEQKSDTIRMGQLEQQAIEMESFLYGQEHNPALKNNKFPANFEQAVFPSLNTLLLELNAGKIDYISGLPKCTADYIVNSDASLTALEDETLRSFHMGTRIDATKLQSDLDRAIVELRTYGVLDRLTQDYITDLSGDPVPNEIVSKPDVETYVVGITGDQPPMDYVTAAGTPAGFNVALLNAIAQINDCNFEVVQVDASARQTALASGKIDIIFWLSCLPTEGFEGMNEDLLLTEPYYNTVSAFVTKDFPTEKIKEIYSLQ